MTLALLGFCWLGAGHDAHGQRIQIPDFFSSSPTGNLPVPPSTLPPITPEMTQPSLVPSQPLSPLTSGAVPVFPDPRNLQSDPGWVVPPTVPPATYSSNPVYGAPTYGTPWQSSTPFQGTGSTWQPAQDWSWPQQTWASFQNNFLPRLLERPRARYTLITGSGQQQLNLNELELATTLMIPRFFGGTQPLRVSPGFIWHWLDGPDSTVNPGFDLPARVYSTYIAADHMTDPAATWGWETNLTVGYYTDFDNTSSNAIRLTGKLVGWARLNSYTVAKAGVEYLDRVDVKLLPAFGIYMAPTSDIRWDLYFPRTKLAHRLPNLANFEVWSYLGAEYGGGSWAIDRSSGVGDQADINDVRAFVGVEWMGQQRITGLLEIGYVFNREIVYRSAPLADLELKDAFLFRYGVAF